MQPESTFCLDRWSPTDGAWQSMSSHDDLERAKSAGFRLVRGHPVQQRLRITNAEGEEWRATHVFGNRMHWTKTIETDNE